jgi:hypothetical protein
MNIGEACVFLVMKLLRNDCEKLKIVYVSTACTFGKQNPQITTISYYVLVL